MTDPNGAAEGSPFVAPSLLQAGLKGLCPRCGCATLFAGPPPFAIRFEARCDACGLDLSAYNVGDGPAAFLTLIVGTLIVALAIWLQLAASPPLWVHAIVWPPVTLVAVLGSLRIAKAALLAAEYRNAAREGRVRDDGSGEDQR